MIEEGVASVFAVPDTLIDDIDRNMRAEVSAPTTPHPVKSDANYVDVLADQLTELAAISTGFQFVDHSRNEPSATTEYAVAELCSTVYGLPNSDPRRSSLLRKINRSNGGLAHDIKTQHHQRRRRTPPTPIKTTNTNEAKPHLQPPSAYNTPSASSQETNDIDAEDDAMLRGVIQKLSDCSLNGAGDMPYQSFIHL